MTEFEEKMQQLRAEYRQTITADIRSLQQLATQLHGVEQDRATLEQMIELLHRMAGGAGVFGLEKLSEQAHALELELLGWMDVLLAGAYHTALPDIRVALAALAANV